VEGDGRSETEDEGKGRMRAAADNEVRHGDHRSTNDSCQDGFKYKVVEQDGRYRFVWVQVTSGIPCAGETLASLVGQIEGAWLDEVDVEMLRAVPCGKGGACSVELANMVQDLKDLLL
jgi:hypothetical protein